MRILFVCPSICLSVCQSVRPSVRPSVKLEERSVQIFTSYERSFSLVFSEEEWLVGGQPFLPEIVDQLAPVGAKSPILNRYSLLAPQP